MIGNLAFDSPTIQRQLGEQGAVAPLVKMLSMGIGSVAAAGSLWSLSFCAQNRGQIAACGGVAALEALQDEFASGLAAAAKDGASKLALAALKIGTSYTKGTLFALKCLDSQPASTANLAPAYPPR